VGLIPGAIAAAAMAAGGIRAGARRRRGYVRLVVEPYRSDRLAAEALVAAFATLHSLVSARGVRRIVTGQPSLAVEVHHQQGAGGAPLAWLGVSVPERLAAQAVAAIRGAYPNCRLRRVRRPIVPGGPIIRLHKRRVFTEPVRRVDELDPDRPPVERLIRAMDAAGGWSVFQIALTPAPLGLGRLLGRRRAARTGEGDTESVEIDRSRFGGPFFWADVRLVGQRSAQLTQIAAELRAGGGANRLVGRRARGRRRAWAGRIERGEANRLPTIVRATYAAEEIAGLWHLPSPAFAGVPVIRGSTPLAPAPAAIRRARAGMGLLADEHGPVTIDRELRRQNTAVVGTVEQGKTSYLVASVREDLARADCAVIVLDPKGDAADAALSVVPDGRVCTLLDMARPTCGFNPLAVDAPVDAIADYVVASVRQLFADGEVRGSSDRYLRNAVIAALAFDRASSLWDVARLLEVGSEGTAARALVADRLAGLPEFAEVASFLAEELPVQLRDARSATTAKLDAPANKLARVLNSTSVKRILLNESLTIDFDGLIDRREVLIVRGGLGELGAGNVSVLMALLLGMLDAALGRAQDRTAADRRTAVALKVDEAPLVITESFAQTMALKRSAGLETVACWQTDAQWPEELRDQLDALFAHRVLFATASAVDARASAGLLMGEFADQLRVGDQTVATLAAPDVRLHLPRYTAVVSWTTPAGRDRPFVGRTIPLRVDAARIDRLAELQRERGGREAERLVPRRRLVAAGRPELALGGAGAGVREAETAMQQPPTAARRRGGEADGRRRVEAADEVPTAVQSPSDAGDSPQRRRVDEPAGATFAELVAVDAATGVRWLPVAAGPRRPRLDPREFELLAWIAGARCVLSSQAHRRTSPGQALTTTQRRLKRLADAGLVGRFQLHGGDGGGVPFCCAATQPAIDLLELGGRRAPVLDDANLGSLRRDLHTVGWLLALEARAATRVVSVLGPGRARVAPPAGSGPAGLGLEPGLHARDFVCGADGNGRRRPVVEFIGVSPAAAVEVRVRRVPGQPTVDLGGGSAGSTIDLRGASGELTTDLLVFHGPADPGEAVRLLERLDHLLAGWWRLVPRYSRLGTPPTVVILAPDPDTSIRLAEQADPVLIACLARIGEPPERWPYPARAGVVFASEPDVHRGVLDGWRVAELPPAVRAGTDGSPPAGRAAELRRHPIVDLAAPTTTDPLTGKPPPPPPWR
jgi:hypothetical protein